MRVYVAASAAATVLTLGLAGGAAGQIVADSGNVRVTTIPALDSSAAEVSVGPEAMFRVGLDPGGRLFERITGLALLSDGSIAVGDGGATQEIVVLGTDGTVDRVLGGRGEGPGEFTSLGHLVGTRDGGVAAQDYWSGRFTLFDAEDTPTSIRMPPLEQLTILGTAGDSLFMGPPLQLVRGMRYPTPWRQVALGVLRIGSDGVDTVRVVDWDQSLEYNGRDPWAAEGFAAFYDREFIYGRGDIPEVRWYGLDGDVVRTTRFESGPQPVSAEDRAAWQASQEASWNERFGTANAQVRALFQESEAQVVGVKPYFDALKVGPDGSVWLGEWYSQAYGQHSAGRRYFLLERDGAPAGSVVMPMGFRLLAVDRDRVIGSELGPFGEQMVVAYPLVPTGTR